MEKSFLSKESPLFGISETLILFWAPAVVLISKAMHKMIAIRVFFIAKELILKETAFRENGRQ
jgi:hypothetical protein